MLTGKCKEEFEIWYVVEVYHNWLNNGTVEEWWLQHSVFNELPLHMKYGAYKQFFLDKDILIYVKPYIHNSEKTYATYLNGKEVGTISDEFITCVESIIRIANKNYNDTINIINK